MRHPSSDHMELVGRALAQAADSGITLDQIAEKTLLSRWNVNDCLAVMLLEGKINRRVGRLDHRKATFYSAKKKGTNEHRNPSE